MNTLILKCIKLIFILSLLIGVSFAGANNCAYKINKIASDFIAPDHVTDKALAQSGLYKSQLSYGNLNPLSMRKIGKLEAKLRESEIILVENLSVGVNESWTITFTNKLRGIMKPHYEVYESNYRSEILAYELDQLFGFNLVPITFERSYKGRKSSIQLFMESSDTASIKKGQIEKQKVFDWLINSKDRHDGNFLISKKGEVISIDNGISLTGRYLEDVNHFGESLEEIDFFLNSFEGKQIIKKINMYKNDDQFRSQMIAYLGSEDTSLFFERVSFLTLYAKNYKKNKSQLTIILDILGHKDLVDSDLALLLEVLDKSDLEFDSFVEVLIAILKHENRGDESISAGLKLLRSLEDSIGGERELIGDILKDQNLADKSYAQLIAYFFDVSRDNVLNIINKVLSKPIRKHESILMINEVLERDVIDQAETLQIIKTIIRDKKISDKALAQSIETIIQKGYNQNFEDDLFLSIILHPSALDESLSKLAVYTMTSSLDLLKKEEYLQKILTNQNARHITMGRIASLLKKEKIDNMDLVSYINMILFNHHAGNFTYREILSLIDSINFKLENIEEIYSHIILNMKPEMALIGRLKGSMKEYGFDLSIHEKLSNSLIELEANF